MRSLALPGVGSLAVDRLSLFRELLQRFDVTEAAGIVRGGMYVAPPGRSIVEQLTTWALAPDTPRVLVGGIGSGKTTQLLIACEKLPQEDPDTRAVYVDVGGSSHRLEKLEVGALVSLTARAVAAEDAQDLSDTKALRNALREDPRRLVMLFDSLDRVDDVGQFMRVVRHDFHTLKELGVGVVTTAPLRALFAAWRNELDGLGELIPVPPVDVTTPEGWEFLQRVLAGRDPSGMFTREARDHLVKMSGGVMRDLIALARAAAEDAYLRGGSVIDREHALAAGERFGRSLSLGLSSHEVDLLQRVVRGGRFDPFAGELDLSLLVTRRIVQYQSEGALPRYAVHPTLTPLLPAVEDAA